MLAILKKGEAAKAQAAGSTQTKVARTEFEEMQALNKLFMIDEDGVP